MAFEQTVTTSSNYSASYWALMEWTFNRTRQEVQATFRVFKDQQSRDAGALPATEQVAKLRLQGEEYQRYFGDTRNRTEDDQTILYRAAEEQGINSDFGGDPDNHGKRQLFKKAKKV
jgi:hypothetical protein